jgi:hypothetical protein
VIFAIFNCLARIESEKHGFSTKLCKTILRRSSCLDEIFQNEIFLKSKAIYSEILINYLHYAKGINQINHRNQKL